MPKYWFDSHNNVLAIIETLGIPGDGTLVDERKMIVLLGQ